MKAVFISGVVMVACSLALAKLPPLDDAAKAKAAEAAAKAGWQAKIDGYQLCKAQDKVAAAYSRSSGKAVPVKDVKSVAAMTAPAANPAAPAASAAVPAASAPAPSGTPVAFAPPTPCTDPGPFAYNPPEQKPLETSGAHSPTGTAASPPRVKTPSAEMAPAKK
ncbi:MAG: hypothetical protein ABIR26_04360 [Ramlibacter sp.]